MAQAFKELPFSADVFLLDLYIPSMDGLKGLDVRSEFLANYFEPSGKTASMPSTYSSGTHPNNRLGNLSGPYDHSVKWSYLL